jgi:cytidylate kinase
MSSIIISTDFSSVSQTIAQRTAEALGYEYLGPEYLTEVAKEYKVSAEKLAKALDPNSSSWAISSKNRSLYLAYIQAAVLGKFLEDNLVCQGLAAHLYVHGISHVLTVRILADTKLSVNQIAAEKNVTPKKARQILDCRERRRRRWSEKNFGVNEFDPSLYDMVISLSQIEADKAVEVIKDMVGYRKFQPMTYSLKCVKDKALACTVRAALGPRFPRMEVQARDGTVVIKPNTLRGGKGQQAEALKERTYQIPGVEYVEVHPSKNFVRQSNNSQS